MGNSVASTKNKSQLLLLVLAFVIPVILAKLFLTFDFKGQVKTHGGELLSIDATYPQMLGDIPLKDKKWRVVFFTNQPCTTQCIDGLFYIQQTYKALGRLQERVSLDLLNTSSLESASIPDELSLSMFSQHLVSELLMPELNNKVVIIDPLGNLVMSYVFDAQREQNLIKAHDMLLDIKKLLKLSRIG